MAFESLQGIAGMKPLRISGGSKVHLLMEKRDSFSQLGMA
jgi:hypothetical protein